MVWRYRGAPRLRRGASERWGSGGHVGAPRKKDEHERHRAPQAHDLRARREQVRRALARGRAVLGARLQHREPVGGHPGDRAHGQGGDLARAQDARSKGRAGEAPARVRRPARGGLRGLTHDRGKGPRMPAKIYYDQDADLGLLKGKKIAIIGYGSQGHAHALNLKDSGQDVIVGLYQGSKSWAKAEKDGLKVAPVADAAKAGDVVMILLPDQTQRSVFEESIRKGLGKGKMLMFAHGFNIHFNQVVPPSDVDVTMIAPKAPGHVMRDLFTQGPGVPALVAVQQDVTGKARDLALAYGRGVGCTRAGVIETTFKEETETDLFGEPTTLCGGVSQLIKAAFETLVEAGYQPEVAYFECMHEMKLIVDLFYQGGLAYMRYSVSDTAEYGDYTRGPRVVSEETKAEMKRILGEIQSGQFAREWVLENQANRAGFLAMRRRDAEHPIEEVGKRLRSMMSWIQPPRMG